MTEQENPNSKSELQAGQGFATIRPARRRFTIKWEWGIASILIPLLATLITVVLPPLLPPFTPIPPSPTPPLILSLRMYFGNNTSFTLVADANTDFRKITLVTVKNRATPAAPAQDFAGYLSSGIVSGGKVCLQYRREGSNPALPRECLEQTIAYFNTLDPFWYDDASAKMYEVQLWEDTTPIGDSCSPQEGHCTINQ